MKKHDISVVVPVYKEEKRVERCIIESLFFFRNNPLIGNFEIIFVADRSGDQTISTIQKHLSKNKELKLIVNQERLRKGFSVRAGAMQAKYGLILFYDNDLSTPLCEVNKFLEIIDDYDILIASRALKESKIERKFFKMVLSRGFSFWKRLILNMKIKDTQCGFKMFKRHCRVIFEKQTIRDGAFDVELLYLAKKFGFHIKEVPITWIDSDSSNFTAIGNITHNGRDIVKIRMNDLRGVYNK